MRLPRLRAGISRIDLLFATAVIGVLAAIVWGNLQKTQSGASIDLLKSDLRELQVVEERYWTQNSRYATDTTQIAWKSRPEVAISISSADPATGVDAEARHRDLPGVTCRMYVGRAVGRQSGVIDCSKP
jgi:Tfp pilus assembly protein PilE